MSQRYTSYCSGHAVICLSGLGHNLKCVELNVKPYYTPTLRWTTYIGLHQACSQKFATGSFTFDIVLATFFTHHRYRR